MDRISILTNQVGVCDVVIYQGHTSTQLQQGLDPDCHPEIKGVTEKMLRVTDQAPLVGFHGMADEMGIYALSAIFADGVSPGC